MANQYSGSFECIIHETLDCSAKDALQECINQDLSYFDAAKRLGFSPSTIRKWAKRFNLQLRAGKPPKSNPDQFMHFFKEKTLNKDNALNRSWLTPRLIKVA